MKLTMTAKALRVTCGGVVIAAVTLGVGIGCEKKGEPAKTNVPKPPAPDVTPKAMSGGATGSTANGGLAGGPTSAKPTTPAPATQPSAAATNAAADDTAPLITSTDTAKKSKEAQDLIAKAMQSLKDNKFDDAKASLDKVDAMGDAVSATTREQSKTVRESLNKAQQLQKAPEVPSSDGPNK